jgi:hypothetical protein
MSETILSLAEQKEMLIEFIKELEKRSMKIDKIMQVFKTFLRDRTDDSIIEIHQLTTEIVELNEQQSDIYFGGYRVENLGLLKDINTVLSVLAADYDLYLRNQPYSEFRAEGATGETNPINLASKSTETPV